MKHKEIVEDKVVHTEQQLQELKKNLEQRKVQHKSLFKKVFARK